MAGDLDAHRHLGGIAPDWVIGGDCWLTLHLSCETFTLVHLPLQTLLCRCGERRYERPCRMVDIRLGHHRVVIGVLPVMKRHRILDRDARQATEAIEIERGNVAMWPNHGSMGGHGGLALNRRVPGRNDCRGISHDLDAIVPGGQGASAEGSALRSTIVERYGPPPHPATPLTAP